MPMSNIVVFSFREIDNVCSIGCNWSFAALLWHSWCNVLSADSSSTPGRLSPSSTRSAGLREVFVPRRAADGVDVWAFTLSLFYSVGVLLQVYTNRAGSIILEHLFNVTLSR